MPMHHHCPECEEEVRRDHSCVALEEYPCSMCHDVYCAHFVKKIARTGDTGPRVVCWVCGSEKKKGTEPCLS